MTQSKLDNMLTPATIQVICTEIFRGRTHKEWAEITGYCERTLQKMASEGYPAWKKNRWHPASWILWSAGIIPVKKRGRKRSEPINGLEQLLRVVR